MKIIALLIVMLLAFNVKSQTSNISADSKQTERYTDGFEKMSEIDAVGAQKVVQKLQAFSPDMGRYVVEYPYGDVYIRNILTDKEKEMAIVGALVALGNARPQLKYHLNAALNLGVSEEKLKEIMILMSVYSGFPTALNGTFALEEVITERKLKR